MKKCILSITLLILTATQTFAESSVWRAEKESSVFYLGGTVHLLRQSDFPLPPEFQQAYEASGRLVFETDIGALNTPAMQQKLMSQAMYTDGSTLTSHLSPETGKMLSDYCTAAGIPLAAIQQFKPSIAVVTLTMMELMKLGITQDGVDTVLHKQAISENKPVEGLESTDEQINFLVNMGKGNEDKFVSHSIEELKTTAQDYPLIISAWRKGDMKTLDEFTTVPFRKDFPELYKELVTDRNKNWLTKISHLQQTPETEFILVGAAHLLGEEGILDVLKRDGYRIEKLNAAPASSTPGNEEGKASTAQPLP